MHADSGRLTQIRKTWNGRVRLNAPCCRPAHAEADALKRYPSPTRGALRHNRPPRPRSVARVMLPALIALALAPPALAEDELLPKHVTSETVKAVRKALDYLARQQAPDGSWRTSADGNTYPCA